MPADIATRLDHVWARIRRAAERLGVPLARVSPELRQRLAAALPPTAALDNPVDLVGDSRADRYAEVLAAVREAVGDRALGGGVGGFGGRRRGPMLRSRRAP